MHDLEAVALGEPGGYQRPVTSLSGGFYAHQRGDAVDRRLTD